MMKISDQINKLTKERNTALDELEAYTEQRAADDGEWTDADDQRCKEWEQQAEALKREIDALKRAEQAIATRSASPVVTPTGRPAFGTGGRAQKQREKGTFFAYMAHALYVNGGNRVAAAEYAKTIMDDDELSLVLRAPSEPALLSVDAWAGALDSIRHAAEQFIEMLRPMSILAQTPSRRMSFDVASQIKIPRQTAGASGAYLGEGAAIPTQKQQYDSIVLTPKKIACITFSSNEMLAHSSPSLMALLRDDMLLSTATVVDGQFISETAGTTILPPGLGSFPAAPITGTAGGDLAAMTADLKAAYDALTGANVNMVAPVWIMNTAQANALMFVRDGNGNHVYKDEMASGTLYGIPFIVSTTMTAGELYLLDANYLMYAEDLAPTVDISESAVLHDDDTDPEEDLGGGGTTPASPMSSLWQRDMTGVRLRWRHDWNMRQSLAVAHVKSITW